MCGQKSERTRTEHYYIEENRTGILSKNVITMSPRSVYTSHVVMGAIDGTAPNSDRILVTLFIYTVSYKPTAL